MAEGRLLFSSKSHHDNDKRPAEKLVEKVDEFVTTMAGSAINDKKILDMDRLIEIKDSLHEVVEQYERRAEFRVKEEMSARKRELDILISKAEEDYIQRKKDYDTQMASLERELQEKHRRVLEVQRQTLIKELKNMSEYLFYHTQIIQEIAGIDASLEAASCCSRFFCCFPSKEIQQKQKQLALLRAEQAAFASEDHALVSQMLADKIEKDRTVLLEQQNKLTANPPQETAQLLRNERTQLQANIDANREAYYHEVSPRVMLSLVRLQSFASRMQKRLGKAKSAAQTAGDTIKINFYNAILGIVNAFCEQFNKICQHFVCVPPANPANRISYAQYYDRYHALAEQDKKFILNAGQVAFDADKPENKETPAQKFSRINNEVFREHTQPLPRIESVVLMAVPSVST